MGLCGYKGPADAGGTVEIGYGIAPSRRNRGHATGAVRDMLAYAARDLSVSIVVAATSVDNLASQVVLKRNGFLPSGVTNDPDDGELVWWRNELH